MDTGGIGEVTLTAENRKLFPVPFHSPVENKCRVEGMFIDILTE
jgi:hypothetical protein